MPPFVKRDAGAPAGFFACEAAGLQWLSAAPGGVPCATVLAVDDTGLTLERLTSATPTRAAAQDFGRRLARTHDAGAGAFGAAPDGWSGPGFFGPLHQPLPMSLTGHDRWGAFYARERLAPMAALAAGRLDAPTRAAVTAVIDRCESGDFDDDDPPARLHGDLWSGNVMWTRAGAVLIDPAAHGGHRETDLAMLALFGCPHLDTVLGGYQQRRPLRDGWQARVGLYQLYPLLAHVVLFGGGYAGQTAAAARAAVAA
ncbi:fructosamine kinase family protein [Mycobacterium sp. IDR2000157661]|uniref:fructosamine kinase family protein n=1 Tax=Mycobacterium sp. IDR2000157661 TaxID=2867005 RepID=UPI001EEDFD1F|nr:fructosamine kinase family protein [Mycobacterium sp. IDR2000157661]ULE34829.1 fructosamine kinase family protein [Mycobacterium sp. IDR2000157661]